MGAIDLPGADAIVVRHLMSHTSEGVPGSTFLYNGNRFGELDKVIEGVTSRTFAELIAERILQPLGLRHTAPNVEDAESFRHAGLDRREFIDNMAHGIRGER
jgi:CubicO group peptidase (beta-lactamase class C family)